MEAFVAALGEARKRLAAADHILTQSYPLIKDPKLLVAVMTNLSRAVEETVESYLAYEVSRQRLAAVPESPKARLALFQRRVPAEFLRLVGELRETMQEHRQSPVEFSRQGSFVICDESYHLRTLNDEQLRRHLRCAKAFLGFIEEKVKRNDAILARRA